MPRGSLITPVIHGAVEAGFEEVEQQFRENFARRGEIGAACTIYVRGHKVVDLWGGLRDVSTHAPWDEDTLVLMYSATKGISALTLALAHARGLFAYDEPVAAYWPEFAQAGKASITVRQLLSHQAGLSAIDEPLTVELLSDLDALAAVLARQKPAWEPGTRHGYHGISLGWFESELLRRVDPHHRSLGQFFQEEIAQLLGLEFSLGGKVPAFPEARIATIYAFTPFQMLLHLGSLSTGMVLAYLNPRSLTRRSLGNPNVHSPADFNLPAWRIVEFPSGGGIGQVRSVAKLYSVFATGGKELGFTPETLQALTSPAAPPSDGVRDEIVKEDTSFSLGLMKPFPAFPFGSEQAFGTPGAGGAFGYADPAEQIGYAYAPNKLGFTMWNDPRDQALREALCRCLRKMEKGA